MTTPSPEPCNYDVSGEQLKLAARLIQVDLDTECIVKHYTQHTIDQIKECRRSLRTTAVMLDLVHSLIYDGIEQETFNHRMATELHALKK